MTETNSMNNLNSAIAMISDQFAQGSLVWLILFGIVFAVMIVYFFRGIYIYSKRSVESLNFIVVCVPVAVWAFFIMAGPLLGLDNSEGTWAQFFISAADHLIPALLMLHIWSQVSYKPITTLVRVMWLVAPIFLIVIEAIGMLYPGFDIGTILYGQLSIATLIANLYFIIVAVKSYLLCFNVFYQMPKHMRRSTYHMIIAISAIVIANGVSTYFTFSQNARDVALAIAYIVAVYTLYTAFFIANSSNVIVTSRDFVFSSLSTIVITVSLKGNILDWNRKKKDGCYPLPDPKYKEPYPLYRKRIIEMCNGTISPHDDSILNIKGEAGENYFLFTWHDIGFMGHKFGYLVEISEVTKSYSKFRYIEEIAYYDTLTSLHNRNAYIERVKEVSVAGNMPLLIVVGDVNNLKRINDTRGHLFGDRLLITVTNVVSEKAPEKAFVARIGGDELVLLLPNADERDAIVFIAAVTETLNAIDDPDFGMPSVSWGYSVMYDLSENYNDVFRAADAIMYEAKRRVHEISISGVVPQ